MSTCIMSGDDIDFLAPFVLPHYDAEGETKQEKLTAVGRALLRENNASFTYNYSGRHAEELSDPDLYEWQPFRGQAPEDPIFAMRAFAYYLYHSCDRVEKDDDGEWQTIWDDMALFEAVAKAQASIMASAPDGPWEMGLTGDWVNPRGVHMRDLPAWDAAPWGLDDHVYELGIQPRWIKAPIAA